jgi:predicted NBD/HSP70 family sugar kinase
MSQNLNSAVAVIGIDIGKNSFHVVGLDNRGAIVLRRSGRVARSKHGWPIYRRA